MLTIVPTPRQSERAASMAREMGQIRNSITKGSGNFAGFVAEVIVGELLNAQFCSTKDYDLVYNGCTIDVKCKRTAAEPKEHYMNSIAATSTHQDCDYYVFTRWQKYAKVLYILGCISREEYFEKAAFYKKGEREGDNGFVVRADCYSLPISELYPLTMLPGYGSIEEHQATGVADDV